MQFLDLHAARIGVVELDLLLAAAVENDLLQFLRQFVERRLDVEIVVSRKALDHLVVVGRLAVPAANRAAGQRQAGVYDDPIRVEKLLDAQPVAAGAGAAGVVE